ncbi:Endonuclease, Uma2 family (restriction endonuclease fold) [Micromonospora pattaloongensis]|uniref:Endonuclease, Uma2 family (Restriction endonuclease fold) n=1 Tax=Micromonospora pattaloongensis TaxID=405436 RepID=A0A1H3KN12_9ACTN|nr:Uma2 family endonuclease [Micromonospora pattaloongensis]SDY53563.1 Endonuclease, Uma2 family (restriction endonuclease fold) [Micromonospora pattaloongensis]
MAQPASRSGAEVPREPSFDVLGVVDAPWTAKLALDLLPETNGPKVEVFSGSVIVTPHAGIDHQSVERELPYLLHRAARRAGFWAYPEINVISGDDLFIPDLAVLRVSGGGKPAVPISDAVLLGEIVSPGNRRKDVIDRPREYAAAGVPFFLRVDLRNRVPALALYELVEGGYRPISAAAAGSTFVMTEPFKFSIDPAELLDDEAAGDGARDGAPGSEPGRA